MNYGIGKRAGTYFLIFLLAVVFAAGGCGRVPNRRILPLVGSGKMGIKVVRKADSLVGCRYRYGGESPRKGFDCSGLTWYVFRQYGYNLPRTAKQQSKAGKWVPRKRLCPGDLVFFKLGRNRYHVGIYAGRNRFIHAPRSGKRVGYDRLEGYYWKHYYTARRVL